MVEEQEHQSDDDTGRGWLSKKHAPGNLGAIIGMAAAVHGWWTFSGPYRWIAELQAMVFGSYQPMLTAVLTWAALVCVIALPLKGLLWLASSRAGSPIQSQRSMSFAESFGVISAAPRHPLTHFLLGAVPVALGLLLYWHHSKMSYMEQLTAVAIEHGAWPASHWLEVVGVPATSASIEYDVGWNRRYVPLTTPANEPPSTPLHVFVEVPAHTYPAGLQGVKDGSGEVVVRGLRNLTGLPGPVEAHFRDAGLLGRPYIVIRPRDAPLTMTLPMVLIVVGGMYIGLSLIRFFRSRRSLHGTYSSAPR